MWTGEAVGKVELEDESYLYLLRVDGSRVCLHFPNSLTQGWDFGISGSPLFHCPTHPQRAPPGVLLVLWSWWYKGPLWIKDTVTGKEVFELSGRYARPL
jgi:hypothetical protein